MLDGIRILDMTTIVFGPYATEILAGLGADVIKVEPPTGDYFRGAGAPARTHGMGACHLTLNRGKRAVTLDLKDPTDAARARELISGADVFIHNVRASAIERLGFGEAAVRALNAGIVYVHCVGFGAGGRYAGRPAYDDVIQAAAGATTLLPRVDGDPRPRYLPSVIADKVGGLHTAYAMLAAIVHKLRTGEGQFVEVPMFEAFTHFLMQEHLYGATFVPPSYPAGYPRQLDPMRQPFPTADGHIAVAAYTDAAILRLIGLIGAESLLDDARFETSTARRRHMTDLYTEIASRTPARATADWMSALIAAEIPAMPVRDLADVTADPHLADVGFFSLATHPSEGEYLSMRGPVRFSAMADSLPSHAPHLAERNAPITWRS